MADQPPILPPLPQGTPAERAEYSRRRIGPSAPLPETPAGGEAPLEEEGLPEPLPSEYEGGKLKAPAEQAFGLPGGGIVDVTKPTVRQAPVEEQETEEVEMQRARQLQTARLEQLNQVRQQAEISGREEQVKTAAKVAARQYLEGALVSGTGGLWYIVKPILGFFLGKIEDELIDWAFDHKGLIIVMGLLPLLLPFILFGLLLVMVSGMAANICQETPTVAKLSGLDCPAANIKTTPPTNETKPNVQP